MEILLSEEEINEVEELLTNGNLTRWLCEVTSHTNSILFILESIYRAIDEIKGELH